MYSFTLSFDVRAGSFMMKKYRDIMTKRNNQLILNKISEKTLYDS